MVLNFHKINRFLVENFNFVLLRGFPRHSTRFAKKYFKNKEITAVEVGTYEGYNAKSILKELNIGRFYVIDPYENYSDYASSEPETVMKLVKAQKMAKRKLKKYLKKIVWIKKRSEDAIKDLPEVDFIYIDGNHKYEYVKKDMENCFKKLKKGGILAGHDIASFHGVGEALIEFCSERKIKPRITVTDWWFIKK